MLLGGNVWEEDMVLPQDQGYKGFKICHAAETEIKWLQRYTQYHEPFFQISHSIHPFCHFSSHRSLAWKIINTGKVQNKGGSPTYT